MDSLIDNLQDKRVRQFSELDPKPPSFMLLPASVCSHGQGVKDWTTGICQIQATVLVDSKCDGVVRETHEFYKTAEEPFVRRIPVLPKIQYVTDLSIFRNGTYISAVDHVEQSSNSVIVRVPLTASNYPVRYDITYRFINIGMRFGEACANQDMFIPNSNLIRWNAGYFKNAVPSYSITVNFPERTFATIYTGTGTILSYNHSNMVIGRTGRNGKFEEVFWSVSPNKCPVIYPCKGESLDWWLVTTVGVANLLGWIICIFSLIFLIKARMSVWKLRRRLSKLEKDGHLSYDSPLHESMMVQERSQY